MHDVSVSSPDLGISQQSSLTKTAPTSPLFEFFLTACKRYAISSMTLDDYRRFYADEIRIAADLRNAHLVQSFATVPRERYLGPPPWHICSGDRAALTLLGLNSELYTATSNPADLYHNILVAIDPRRSLNNGNPSMLARWIDDLELKPGSRVYHAGCGVGYYTAILAEMVAPNGSVVAIDVDPDLAARARENLANYPHVTVHTGDGAAFDPGLCDAMLINAGVTHPHRPWLDRIKPGGCIILPITAKGSEYHGNGVMVKLTREPSGFSARVVSFVSIYSFSTLRDLKIEPLLTAAMNARTLFKLKSLILTNHEEADTCIIHTSHMCLSSKSLT